MLYKPNETKPVQMRSKFIFRMVGFLQGLTEVNFETSSTVTYTSFYNSSSFWKDLSQIKHQSRHFLVCSILKDHIF